MLNQFLAMNPGNADGSLNGIPTKEPTYGIDALWIKEAVREEAIAKGYTVVDLIHGDHHASLRYHPAACP